MTGLAKTNGGGERSCTAVRKHVSKDFYERIPRFGLGAAGPRRPGPVAPSPFYFPSRPRHPDLRYPMCLTP